MPHRATLDRHLARRGASRRQLRVLGSKRTIRLHFEHFGDLWVGGDFSTAGGVLFAKILNIYPLKGGIAVGGHADVVVYEPVLEEQTFFHSAVIRNLEAFKQMSDVTYWA